MQKIKIPKCENKCPMETDSYKKTLKVVGNEN
jgi:cytochrome oxidase Cu insertion factor (SCO1/SenC/PrrC family)